MKLPRILPRVPRAVLVVGIGSAIGAVLSMGMILFVPHGDTQIVLACFAGFILLTCVVALNLPSVVHDTSFIRWDKMPEKVQCPDCKGSGALEYRRDGTRVPLPFHLVASFANGHTCALCGGAGTTAQHPAARTGTWKRSL